MYKGQLRIWRRMLVCSIMNCYNSLDGKYRKSRIYKQCCVPIIWWYNLPQF